MPRRGRVRPIVKRRAESLRACLRRPLAQTPNVIYQLPRNWTGKPANEPTGCERDGLTRASTRHTPESHLVWIQRDIEAIFLAGGEIESICTGLG